MLSPIDNSKRGSTGKSPRSNADEFFFRGLQHLRGVGGVKKDLATAARLLQCAVNLGHSGASNNLGVMHHKGVGVPLDRSLAMQFWAKAAERGEAVAMFNLANAYYNGGNLRNEDRDGLTEDSEAMERRELEKALLWYSRAAEKGHAPSICNLAAM